MTPQVDLEFTAKDASKAVERRDLIVVIDVLRAGSTITNLLASGAESVIPVPTLNEAYQLRRRNPHHLLLGERKGWKPRGFDFGNSPLGFTKEQVHGKNIIMTTTSGTSALVRCRSAKFVFIGSLLNSGEVAKKASEIAQKHGLNISFVLSGDKGQFSLEDFLCAGAIAQKLPKLDFSDKVYAALLAFQQTKRYLCENIMKAQHAQHLVKLGFVKDVEFCCQINAKRIVPVYRGGEIMLLKSLRAYEMGLWRARGDLNPGPPA